MATPSGSRPPRTEDEAVDAEGGSLLTDETYWWHIALAAGAGVLATAAMFTSPLFGAMPPIIPPYLPIDLRLVALPLFFAVTQAFAPQMGWPGKATATLGLAVFSALGAHLHASAALSYAGVAWAVPGTQVHLLGMAATLGSIVLALLISLETARERFTRELAERGLPEDQIDAARAAGDALTATTLTTAGLAVAVLGLTVRIASTFLSGNALPLPEVAALAIVLGLGAVLLGVSGREDLPG